MQRAPEPQQAYAAYLQGNLSTLAQLLAEQVCWHAEGDDGVALTLSGRRDVLHYLLGRLGHGVTSGRRGPAPLADRIDAFRLQHGRIVECWEHCGALGAATGVRTGAQAAGPGATARSVGAKERRGDARALTPPSRMPRARIISGLVQSGRLRLVR